MDCLVDEWENVYPVAIITTFDEFSRTVELSLEDTADHKSCTDKKGEKSSVTENVKSKAVKPKTVAITAELIDTWLIIAQSYYRNDIKRKNL